MADNAFYDLWATEGWPSQHIVKMSKPDVGAGVPTQDVVAFCGLETFVPEDALKEKPVRGKPTCENCFRDREAAKAVGDQPDVAEAQADHGIFT